MNELNFQYKKSYAGLWNNPNKPGSQMSGTLFLDDQSMRIELYCQEETNDDSIQPPMLMGVTFSADNDSKKESFKIMIERLHFLQNNRFGNGVMLHIYDVGIAYFYENKLDFDNISGTRLCADILNKWASDWLRSSYNLEMEEKLPLDQHVVWFRQNSPYTLHKDEQIKVFLYSGYSHYYRPDNQGIKQVAFFDIKFNSPKHFHEALAIQTKYQYLLYLLLNRTFPPRYNMFRTSSGNFSYKVSEKYAYRYFETAAADFNPLTQLADFTKEQIQSIFTEWGKLYERYAYAISLYFDTVTNIYVSPASQVKNYISVIDAFTASMNGEACEINKNTKKSRKVNQIIEKIEGVITKEEKNYLKTQLLWQKEREIKSRFKSLIKELDHLLPDEINDEFVEKIINTRNNITHPKDNEDYAYSELEYEECSYLLKKIVRAKMLTEIGVEGKIAKKILEF